MASTFSPLKIELIAVGEQSGTWGDTTNTNLGTALEQAIVGRTLLETGDFSSNVCTLSYSDTNALQDFRALVLDITATLTAAATLNVPATNKPYIVINNSSGGHAVTVKVADQTGVSVPNGARILVYNNGSDVVPAITYLTSLTLGSPLGIASGGTGQATATGAINALLPSQGSNSGKFLTTNGSQTAWGEVNLGTASVTGTLAATNGGTGFASYAVGDLLFASTTTALSKLADVATGNALISGGVGVAPAWGKIGMTTHVSGILAGSNGGTNSAFFQVSGPSTLRTYTFPDADTTVVGAATTQTLTNKRITARVNSSASVTSPLAWNGNNFDMYAITAQGNSLTISADAGTPTNGQRMVFRIRDNGTPQTLAWTTGVANGFQPVGVDLPLLTLGNRTLYVGCIYNTYDERWDVVAVAEQE
jgi:hypothetical protein